MENNEIKILKKENEKLKKEIKDLKNKNYELRYIIDSVDANIYWKDKNLSFLGSNKCHSSFCGVDEENIIGKYDDDQIFPWFKQFDQIRFNDQYVIDHRIKKEIEVKIDTRHGKNKTYFDIKRPLLDKKGEIKGVLGVAIDITDRKKLESELIEKKNQLEKKLEYQKSYLKSYGYDWVFSLKKMSNALDGMNKRLLQFDVPLSVRDDLCPEFRDSNEALSEIYTMYQNMNASILEQDNEDSVLNEMQIEFEEFISTEVNLANSQIDAKYDKKIVLDIEAQLKTKLYVDHKKLRHILRTLFANFIQGITERNNVDIMFNIAAQDDNKNDKLYVTFSFSGNMPFLEVCDDNIRAEYIVYPKTIDTHNFSYEVSRAMYYANLLCGDEDLNKTLFEGKSFSFVLPFKKFDKPQPKEFKPFVV
jgi:PAS domain S-box-containing protein